MEGFADIEGPVRIGLGTLLLLAGLAAVVLAAVVLGLRSLLRRRSGNGGGPVLPERSPLEVALERLDRLQSEGLGMDTDPFIVEVSNIVRDYLETAMEIPAREQTSEEFLLALQQEASLPEVLQARMPEFLDKCDLVKFARQSLEGTGRDALLETAGTVVSETDASLARQPDPSGKEGVAQ
jgi:hypothetical protein